MTKWIHKFVKNVARLLSTRIIFISLTAVGLMLAPFGANGQFGVDPCCPVLTLGLKTVAGLLTNQVASPLNTIGQIQQSTSNFEREVLYPISSITRAQSLAVALRGQMQSAGQIFRVPTASATLPVPQQLESVLLSHNPNISAQITVNYAAVYGKVTAPSNAPPAVRSLVDMSDAEAQAALKKAVQLDAIADIESQAADQIAQQLQTATPGTAPMLEAQASAWVVRANAYTQSAVAELVRIRSIDLANSSAEIKMSANSAAELRGTTGGVLGQGGK